MKASELIDELQRAIDKFGDLEVVCDWQPVVLWYGAVEYADYVPFFELGMLGSIPKKTDGDGTA